MLEEPNPSLSNDHLSLTPVAALDGPALLFDFPGVLVGSAEYAEGPTGCTVFSFPKRASAVADIRGGSHATLFSTEIDRLDAICLAGGSQLGLEAATGVADEILAVRGYSTHWDNIPLVAGAIIYDYGLRGNSIFPDRELGRAALRAAQPGRFLLGARGAGRSATVGKALWQMGYRGEASGQGGAFREYGPTKIAVFTVVNALGAITDRAGRVVLGNLNPETGERAAFTEGLENALSAAGGARDTADAGAEQSTPRGNTTLTVVVTNQKLDGPRGVAWALRQLARVVHTSMARAIQPFHTVFDGDVLYAVSTGEIENPAINEVALGALAAEVAWDAVLSIAP